MARRSWLLVLGGGAALALLFGRGVAQIYADHAWYAALGAADVWRARYSALLVLRLFCGAAATLFVFANLYAVRQSVVSLVLPRRIGNLDIGEEVPRRQLTWAAAVLSLAIGAAFAWSQNDWSGYLAARIGKSFAETDPYFSQDLGFFVYRLPFEISMFTWALTVALVVICLVMLLYALTPSLRWEQGRLYVSGYVRRHLTMLAGVLLLLLSWHYRLEMYGVLGHGTAPDGAFSYLDHRIGIPASLLLALVTLGTGLTVLWAGWTGQLRLAFAALTGVLIAVLAGRQIAPFLARRAMDRDPLVRERPYEATRASYTRRAFAVDRIVLADTTTTFASLLDAAPNVPLWDDAALLAASDRPIAGSGVGWLVSDSGAVAIVPTQALGGSLAAYVASAEENGAPVLALADSRSLPALPRLLVVPDSTARPVIVSDSAGQIAAPSLATPFVRLAFALSMQDFRIWLSTPVAPAPKVVARRGVRERVAAIAPFFAQGSHVAPIWYEDSLVWALELYSSSRTYPLSRRVLVAGEERAYFHHAATALVNASTGRTTFIADSLPGPIAATWIAQFPKLFVREGSLRINLRRQLPPSRDGARAQAVAFGRYGARARSELAQHLPADEGADSAVALAPAPLVAFPRNGSMGDVLPLLDRNERIHGFLVALGGVGRRTAWQPLGDNPVVWTEALDRLRAADTISAGTMVRGYARPIAIQGSVIVVQPRYNWRPAGTPRFLYTSVLVGDTVRLGRSLAQVAGQPPAGGRTGTTDFRRQVSALYEEMRRASARGDWASFGRAFDALGVLVSSRR